MMISARILMRVRGKALAVACAMLAIAGCSQTGELAEPNIREASPRLVSLNPCLDAILLEVAKPHQVLAISHHSQHPASSSIPPELADGFAVTGGTVEEVLALDPDMVLASTFLAPATGQAMRNLELNFRTFASPRKVEESLMQIRHVGELAGATGRAKDLAMRIETALWRHAAPRNHQPISTVLWQPGEIVPGEQALISELMRHAGFSSHSAALGMGQADYLPLEVLLANPPELLLVAGQSRGQLHPALAELEGTRVETLDPVLLYCGGPTIISAMERLADIREDMRGTGTI